MKDPRQLRIAYIGGGSKGWAWQLMGDLALETALCGEVCLYDIDREAARRNAAVGWRYGQARGARANWQYSACEELAEALEGADFVIISILPGTLQEMRSDVHAPEAYGVYQSVGDTTGPGGLLRALRCGPMFAQFAGAIRANCPGAWVINYTNPMAQCVRTLYDVFPQIKAIGCCHEVFGTQELLCRMLAETMGIPGVGRQELRTTVQGVNHFTWLTAARYRDQDLLPAYRAFAERYADTGYGEDSGGNWMNRYFGCTHRVKFDLFLQYGAIAAAGDRHLAEFMPGPRYLRSPAWANAYRFALTPVSVRLEDLARRLAKADRLYRGELKPELQSSGEEGVAMMKALLGLEDMVTNVNLPNRGQLTNAPLGAVVEGNAHLSGDEVTPVQAGEMPPELLALSMPALAAQRGIARAIAAQDASLAWPAFLNDPLLCTLPTADAAALYRKMLEATKAYLPGWRLEAR